MLAGLFAHLEISANKPFANYFFCAGVCLQTPAEHATDNICHLHLWASMKFSFLWYLIN